MKFIHASPLNWDMAKARSFTRMDAEMFKVRSVTSAKTVDFCLNSPSLLCDYLLVSCVICEIKEIRNGTL